MIPFPVLPPLTGRSLLHRSSDFQWHTGPDRELLTPNKGETTKVIPKVWPAIRIRLMAVQKGSLAEAQM